MDIVRNAADGKTYKVFTWRGEQGIWRADIYEGGGYFAFLKKRYGQVVEPPHLDLPNLTWEVVQQSRTSGIADYAEQARKTHQRLVALAQVEPAAAWKMMAKQIRLAERASLQSISSYRAALQARIVEIMKRDGIDPREPVPRPAQKSATSFAEQVETLGEERVLGAIVAEIAANIRQVAGSKTPPPNEQRQIFDTVTTIQLGLMKEFAQYYQAHGMNEESAKVTAGQRSNEFRKRTLTELARCGVLELRPGWDRGW